MPAPDIKIELNSGGFGPAESRELVEHLRVETGLRVESVSTREAREFPESLPPTVPSARLQTALRTAAQRP